MKAQEFDEKFDSGADVMGHLDMEAARRVNLESVRVSLDLPKWMADGLDKKAKRLGITRQELVRVWIAEKLDKEVR